jgi:hypothetical protein
MSTKDPIDLETFVAEVADSNFVDARLTNRLRSLVSSLGKDPKLSLPRALDDAGLEGAYRFLSNHRVTPEEILSSHFAATSSRCEGQETVLVLHDSTTFSYRWDGEREGLGRAQPSRARSNQSFYAHVSLAVCADGSRRPLGIAGFKTWTHGEARSGIEYQRWEEQVRAASRELDGLENAIHIADREADDYEMFFALKRDGHRFVVRSQYDRCIEAEGAEHLRELFDQIPAQVERDVPLNRRTTRRTPAHRKIHPEREKREASLCVAATSVSIKKPTYQRKHTVNPTATLTLNVVRVWEPNPPDNAESVEWFLYTTEPIDTPEQQLAIVDAYRTRWVIEEYFKAIKTGCEFEKHQLQDYEALVNLLAVFAPIAYRLLLIRSEARRDPNQPGLNVVSQDELDVLRARGRRKLSESPTAREVYLAIAAMGGHSKYAPDPGWLTLARGFERLEALTEGWVAAKLQLASDQR